MGAQHANSKSYHKSLNGHAQKPHKQTNHGSGPGSKPHENEKKKSGWDKFTDGLKGAVNWITSPFERVYDDFSGIIKGNVHTVQETVKSMSSTVQQAGKDAGSTLKDVGEGGKGLLDGIGDSAGYIALAAGAVGIAVILSK